MSKIKVLHFAKTFNRFDFVDVVLRFADRRKFQMYAAVYSKTGNPQLPDYDPGDLDIYSLNISHGYLDMFRGAWRLSQLLRKHRVNILHSHHFYESVIAMMACWLYPSCRLIVGRHYHNEFYLTASGFRLRYYLLVEALVNKSAFRIVSPSSKINELLLKQGVPQRKIAFIPYGFDFNAPKYQQGTLEANAIIRKKYDLGDAYLIGNFSRHHSIKGQVFLLEAFSRFLQHSNNAKLLMVGDGPLKDNLQSTAQRLGISSCVIFTGWMNDSHELLSVVDIVVHPTLQEAFPQIMIEALAVGKPLVISAVSGATDIIRNRENGMLVEPGNVEQLVNAITELQANPARAQAMGQRGMSDVRQNLRIGEIIGKFESLYNEAAVR